MNDTLDAIADRIGRALSSRWAIAVFVLVSLTALPQAAGAFITHGDLASLVGWFSQNFVQLVALAVLAFLADRQERAAAAQNAEMYEWLAELHQGLHTKLDDLHDKVDAVGSAAP